MRASRHSRHASTATGGERRSIPNFGAATGLRASDDAAIRSRQQFTFTDVVAKGSAVDDPSRWRSEVPNRIIVRNALKQVVPPEPPVPFTPARGQIWIDEEGRLKFCCTSDASGRRVLKATTVIDDGSGAPGP